MSEVVYDVPIRDVADMLSKSDRQVRRYVKNRHLQARPVRIQGHVKLMFNRREVELFKDQFTAEGVFGESGREIVVDAQLTDQSEDPGMVEASDIDTVEPSTVTYVLDVLKEQIRDLRTENRELHYQLEQRSGQVGFLQGKVETLQDEMKMLMPAQSSPKQAGEQKSWLRRVFQRKDAPYMPPPMESEINAEDLGRL